MAWSKICFIFASVVLDGSVGVKFACAEVTKLLFNAPVINFADEKTRPATLAFDESWMVCFRQKYHLLGSKFFMNFCCFEQIGLRSICV